MRLVRSSVSDQSLFVQALLSYERHLALFAPSKRFDVLRKAK